MTQIVMCLPKVMANETTDTKVVLESMGFKITAQDRPQEYTTLAPEGWTLEWRGRDGAVFNQDHTAVLWLWRKTDIWEPVYTMRLKA